MGGKVRSKKRGVAIITTPLFVVSYLDSVTKPLSTYFLLFKPSISIL